MSEAALFGHHGQWLRKLTSEELRRLTEKFDSEYGKNLLHLMMKTMSYK